MTDELMLAEAQIGDRARNGFYDLANSRSRRYRKRNIVIYLVLGIITIALLITAIILLINNANIGNKHPQAFSQEIDDGWKNIAEQTEIPNNLEVSDSNATLENIPDNITQIIGLNGLCRTLTKASEVVKCVEGWLGTLYSANLKYANLEEQEDLDLKYRSMYSIAHGVDYLSLSLSSGSDDLKKKLESDIALQNLGVTSVNVKNNGEVKLAATIRNEQFIFSKILPSNSLELSNLPKFVSPYLDIPLFGFTYCIHASKSIVGWFVREYRGEDADFDYPDVITQDFTFSTNQIRTLLTSYIKAIMYLRSMKYSIQNPITLNDLVVKFNDDKDTLKSVKMSFIENLMEVADSNESKRRSFFNEIESLRNIMNLLKEDFTESVDISNLKDFSATINYQNYNIRSTIEFADLYFKILEFSYKSTPTLESLLKEPFMAGRLFNDDEQGSFYTKYTAQEISID